MLGVTSRWELKVLSSFLFSPTVGINVYIHNNISYLRIKQIQADSVVHDIAVVRHIPVAAEKKGGAFKIFLHCLFG